MIPALWLVLAVRISITKCIRRENLDKVQTNVSFSPFSDGKKNGSSTPFLGCKKVTGGSCYVFGCKGGATCKREKFYHKPRCLCEGTTCAVNEVCTNYFETDHGKPLLLKWQSAAKVVRERDEHMREAEKTANEWNEKVDAAAAAHEAAVAAARKTDAADEIALRDLERAVAQAHERAAEAAKASELAADAEREALQTLQEHEASWQKLEDARTQDIYRHGLLTEEETAMRNRLIARLLALKARKRTAEEKREADLAAERVKAEETKYEAIMKAYTALSAKADLESAEAEKAVQELELAKGAKLRSEQYLDTVTARAAAAGKAVEDAKKMHKIAQRMVQVSKAKHTLAARDAAAKFAAKATAAEAAAKAAEAQAEAIAKAAQTKASASKKTEEAKAEMARVKGLQAEASRKAAALADVAETAREEHKKAKADLSKALRLAGATQECHRHKCSKGDVIGEGPHECCYWGSEKCVLCAEKKGSGKKRSSDALR
eukprot:TRINITY_DN46490_c0_g1_i1.p1 TRINITY_DN46490_c0_g1~~TRINITY_DN46490_c0_g1_i1.p1  ORF type:complete len:501 (+),score=113.04 TRINITY_DN46490_c0_g1_i1:32-1504(+)